MTGLRGRVVVGTLDLMDGDGKGKEGITDELRHLDFFFRHPTRCVDPILHCSDLCSRAAGFRMLIAICQDSGVESKLRFTIHIVSVEPSG